MCVFKFRSDATEIRVGTLAIKKIEWTIDAKSLPKQKSSKDSKAAIYKSLPEAKIIKRL
ncbi:hypothetical protein DPMN_021294 [Dreissena polymorpha]|uniref:Uncharacterized protein n=1 Tax=Dreissena polymorpha TaxID=45954 RepID=A0A9D4NNV6_DREPO|nr:hypothetical protein DPMN_021294 [Dreissena polymorpha]